MRPPSHHNGEHHAKDHQDQVNIGARGVTLLRYLTSAVIVLCLIGLSMTLNAGRNWYSNATIPCILVSALTLILVQYHRIHLALSAFLWGFSLLPVMVGIPYFGIEAPGLFLLPVSVLAACLLLSPKQGMIMAISTALLCVLVYQAIYRFKLPILSPYPSVKLFMLLTTLFIGSMLGLIGARILRNEFTRVDRLANSLSIKADQLQESEEAQRQLNQQLETRVAERTLELSDTLGALKRAQTELVQVEKLASLGAIVAGIAHELNTPVGNALMATSGLSERQKEFEHTLRSGPNSALLCQFLADVHEVSAIMDRNLHRIVSLVGTFKQLAVNQTDEQRQVFQLHEMLSEVVQTVRAMQATNATSATSATSATTATSTTAALPNFSIRLDIAPGLELESYPGPLAQAILNLINNALIHAFEGRSNGCIRLEAQSLGQDRLRISLTDDGIGIPAQNLARIFDPFFTTKMGQGGSGLGLCIVHNIVTGILGGRIEVQSTPGQGSRFCIDLPIRAKADDDAQTNERPNPG